MDAPYTGPNLGPLQRGAAPAADDWSAFPEAPQAAAAPDQGWDAFPKAEPSAAETAAGIGKASGIGVAKGLIGLAGIGGDLQELGRKGVDFVKSKLPDFSLPAPSPESAANAERYGSRGDLGPSFPLPSSEDIQNVIETVTGPFRKPQNEAEQAAQTVGEFLPAALAGPGGVARKVTTGALIPAAAYEAAGKFSDNNPYVKALAAVLAGGAAHAVSGPGTAAQTLRSQLPDFVTEQHITRAGNLIDYAAQRGVKLTWPEALSRVTGQPVLTDMQRILESHPKSRTEMQSFMSERPQQVEQAARGEFDNIGSQHPNPSTIGAEASAAAGDTLNEVRQTINKASEPYYKSAESVLLTPQEMSHVKAIPGYQEARDAVRETPQLNWRVAHLPDNSVGFLNEVKKYFDTAKENTASKFAQNRNQQVSSTHGMAAEALKQIGEAKSVNYGIALGIQSEARQRYLEPLLNGPLGKIADQPDTKKAIRALFADNPLPGSEGEVRNAVFAIAKRRPAVAEQLVRTYAEMVFNEASKALQGGANQFAGAKFAVRIAGNAQQRANLRAAIEALPNGNERWRGFERLLEVLEATGTRQQKGSLTSFNTEEIKSMSGKGPVEVASKIASPGKYMTIANDAYKAWSLGRNLDQLARIITDPRSANGLRQISRIPLGSGRLQALAGRLITVSSGATTEQRAKLND